MMTLEIFGEKPPISHDIHSHIWYILKLGTVSQTYLSCNVRVKSQEIRTFKGINTNRHLVYFSFATWFGSNIISRLQSVKYIICYYIYINVYIQIVLSHSWLEKTFILIQKIPKNLHCAWVISGWTVGGVNKSVLLSYLYLFLYIYN